MYNITNKLITETIDALIYMTKCHIGIEDKIYRYAEIHNKKRLYGFGDKSVYAYSDILNLQYIFPDLNIIDNPENIIFKLKKMQDQNDKTFYEDTHHFLHTTASAVASLYRWGEKTNYSCAEIVNNYDIINSLEFVRWNIEPWRDSNIPVAIFWLAQCYYGDEKKSIFNSEFTSWILKNSCPETGLWRKGSIKNTGNRGIFPAIAGTFHILFILEYMGLRNNRSEQLYNTCVNYYYNQSVRLFSDIGYVDIDFIYCLVRTFKYINKEENSTNYLLDKMLYEFCNMIITKKNSYHSSDLHKILGSVLVLCEFSKISIFESLFEINVRNAIDAAAYA
ncbi:hypothetical protein ABLB69_12830 [Xenorhabdus khoisanae]|uniref:hypothetical protein n=1 Tax=Xenorhabdus khoisanae TaxID=880157 RepID=UPI0032B77CA8